MDSLQTALGQFYFAEHVNRPPTFLQVVGWTKGAEKPETKRLYVYVRRVPYIKQINLGRGKWEFDETIIRNFAADIRTPVHNSKDPVVEDNAILIPGAQFLRFSGTTIERKVFNESSPAQTPAPPSSPATEPQPIKHRHRRIITSDSEDD